MSARAAIFGDRKRMAWALSLAGFVPFAGLTVLLLILGHTHPLGTLLVDALKTYAAVILSFLGGIRWGLALASSDDEPVSWLLVGSVIPSLVGWFLLFAPAPFAFAGYVLAFAAQGAWDWHSRRHGRLSAWFAKLRMILSALVGTALAIAFLATA